MSEAPATSPAYVERNRRFWNALTDEGGEHGKQGDYGRRQWATTPNWGDWSVTEEELRAIPETVAGRDVVELGCGTAYVSAWLQRAGARPVAVDVSARQLGIAARLQREFGQAFPLVLADAGSAPFADGSFDLAVSEYGASTWCDPELWVGEAARILRPGGELTFLTTSPMLAICTPDEGPAGDRLVRDYFGLRALTYADGTTQFEVPYGEWLSVLRRHGLTVESLTEIRPPEGSRSPWPYVGLDWARRWPAECLWRARRNGSL